MTDGDYDVTLLEDCRVVEPVETRGFTMARVNTNERAATADDRAPKSLAQPAAVTNGDVARRAYDLYLGRGREHGHDVEDWLQAERELRSV